MVPVRDLCAGGLNKVGVKDKQIQTEILETGDPSVQTRIAAKQQGVCTILLLDKQFCAFFKCTGAIIILAL